MKESLRRKHQEKALCFTSASPYNRPPHEYFPPHFTNEETEAQNQADPIMELSLLTTFPYFSLGQND
jgi:hypothetical protein